LSQCDMEVVLHITTGACCLDLQLQDSCYSTHYY